MTSDDASDETRGDARPVLVFIWWPIVIIAIVTGLLVPVSLALGASYSGDWLPIAFISAIGVGGLAFTPVLVRETKVQFRGRGFTGFGRASRETDWGDGPA